MNTIVSITSEFRLLTTSRNDGQSIYKYVPLILAVLTASTRSTSVQCWCLCSTEETFSL